MLFILRLEAFLDHILKPLEFLLLIQSCGVQIHLILCNLQKKFCFCTFIYMMTVFLERMWQNKEELALFSLLVCGLMEMVQSQWAIPGTSLMGACIQQAAVVGLQTGNWKFL